MVFQLKMNVVQTSIMKNVVSMAAKTLALSQNWRKSVETFAAKKDATATKDTSEHRMENVFCLKTVLLVSGPSPSLL
jgi:hypothetical protein